MGDPLSYRGKPQSSSIYRWNSEKVEDSREMEDSPQMEDFFAQKIQDEPAKIVELTSKDCELTHV